MLVRENYVWHVKEVTEIGVEKNSEPVRVLEAKPVLELLTALTRGPLEITIEDRQQALDQAIRLLDGIGS